MNRSRTPIPSIPSRHLARMGSACAMTVLLTSGLLACGGGSGSSSPEAAAPAPAPAPTTISGVVATGAAVPGATVTVKDADPATADVTRTADDQGAYTIDVSSLKPPLVISASGTQNGEAVTVVAVVPTLSSNASNTANVTSLTNAIAALIAPGGDLNALSTPATLASAATPAKVVNASALVVNTLKSDTHFSSLLGKDFDPLTTPFKPDGTGIDAVLDKVVVQASATGVSIANLAAPTTDSGAAAPVVLTAAQTATPTAAPSLPASVAPSSLPSAADMAALARKYEDCLALPVSKRVTVDADKLPTAVSATCNFGPAMWRSGGGNWVERVGYDLREESITGAKAGTPVISLVMSPANLSSPYFQHPVCNTATCVIMSIPMTSASGKPFRADWYVGKLGDKWDFVGNQLPYSMGPEMRMNRKVAVNTVLRDANPTNYFVQDRIESVVRLNFNPGRSPNSDRVRAVRWKGPGLPAAGVVTIRSQRCGTGDRFAITNQEGSLTVNNSSIAQYWTSAAGNDFLLDAATLNGSAMALPTVTGNWATNPSPANQDVAPTAFKGSIPAWSVYTAELFYFTNTSDTPDEIIPVRVTTGFEPAANGAGKNWPVPTASFIDQYLKPTGSGAGSITNDAPVLNWTNAPDSYVSFGYLFSQNRVSQTNSQGETANYWKRGNLYFRLASLGDASARAYEFADQRSGTELSVSTATTGTNPNPRCGAEELVPLDANSNLSSYREVGLQMRGADRKLYQSIQFWSN